MTRKNVPAVLIAITSLSVLAGMALAAQDRFTLEAPNGIAFSEFRGYDAWQDVAVSATDRGIKAILGNPAMINAYKAGIPANGKPFPDGVQIVMIEWIKKQNTAASYVVGVPDTLKSVSFMEKDSKRFPETSGWGFAQFLYNSASQTFSPYGTDTFAKKICYDCHMHAKETDYIFTNYPPR